VPDRCVSRSCTVTCRMAGTRESRVPFAESPSATSTRSFLNAGRYFETGSSSDSFPSSMSIMTPTLVTAFVMEAIRKIVVLRMGDRKSTRLNSSHGYISYAVFCLKKKKKKKKKTHNEQNDKSDATNTHAQSHCHSERHEHDG